MKVSTNIQSLRSSVLEHDNKERFKFFAYCDEAEWFHRITSSRVLLVKNASNSSEHLGLMGLKQDEGTTVHWQLEAGSNRVWRWTQKEIKSEAAVRGIRIHRFRDISIQRENYYFDDVVSGAMSHDVRAAHFCLKAHVEIVWVAIFPKTLRLHAPHSFNNGIMNLKLSCAMRLRVSLPLTFNW